MKFEYELSCVKCGKSIKVKTDVGIWAFGTFDDKDLPKQLNAICSCNKGKK